MDRREGLIHHTDKCPLTNPWRRTAAILLRLVHHANREIRFAVGRCGEAAVAHVNVKPQMQTKKPTLNGCRRTTIPFGSLAALVLFISSVVSCSRVPTCPIAFANLAVPTATDANSVSVTLTNQSGVGVFYLACPLEVNSNGLWSGPPRPPRQRLTKLLPRQSGVIVVDAAATNANTRVPVLWGYDYTPGATRWQEFKEDLAGQIQGRGSRGRLYTNYLINIRL